jgi:molecular chaperone IbpA
MFDLTSLYRSTVGFDHLAQMLDDISGFEAPSYPPYNIERIDEDQYRITMAVAGFREADLNIEVKGNTLTISGKKTAEKTANPAQFLHQGIASRAFECRFQLAGFVEVRGVREWPAPCGPQTRDPGGNEASHNRDPEPTRRAEDDREQEGGLKPALRKRAAPPSRFLRRVVAVRPGSLLL